MHFTKWAGLAACVTGVAVLNGANWPSWRGPSGNQVSPETRFPTHWEWSESGPSKNILWRTPLPAEGNSSPIVWGSRVFITQALEDGARRTLICLDRATGKVQWQQEVAYPGKDPRHETNPHCAASPVTDGERVVVSFASAGVAAYDFSGKRLWLADLGPQQHNWGQGSSPVLHGDQVLVYHGPGRDSALHALDRKTGALKWKVAIPEEQPAERFDGFSGKSDGMMGSFATPLVVEAAGRTEVVLPVANRLQSFSVVDGKRLWWVDGMNPLVYTSASQGEGMIVAMGGYFGSSIFVRTGGEGDLTSKRSFYERRAKKHRIGAPIIRGGHAYLSSTDGFAQCVKLDTGEMVWEERLPATGDGATWASMVLAGDLLYVVNRSGQTHVLRASPTYERVATNPVGELSNSTLALSEGQIFLRTHKALYCVGETPVAR